MTECDAVPKQPVSDAHVDMMAIVERAQVGDREALGQIYSKYADAVFMFVYQRVRNRQLAQDIASATFERVIKRIGSFTYMGSDLKTWLFTIARHLTMDHFNSPYQRRETPTEIVLEEDRADTSPEGRPEVIVLSHINNLVLLAAVKQLNPLQQECIVLRFLCGKSIAETAQIMSKNGDAIKMLQLRAVRTLARLLPDGFVWR